MAIIDARSGNGFNHRNGGVAVIDRQETTLYPERAKGTLLDLVQAQRHNPARVHSSPFVDLEARGSADAFLESFKGSIFFHEAYARAANLALAGRKPSKQFLHQVKETMLTEMGNGIITSGEAKKNNVVIPEAGVERLYKALFVGDDQADSLPDVSLPKSLVVNALGKVSAVVRSAVSVIDIAEQVRKFQQNLTQLNGLLATRPQLLLITPYISESESPAILKVDHRIQHVMLPFGGSRFAHFIDDVINNYQLPDSGTLADMHRWRRTEVSRRSRRLGEDE